MEQITDAQLDVEKVTPGMVIDQDVLESIYKRSGSKAPYDFWLLGFREHLMTQARRAGKPIVLRQIKHALHVLEAPEASEYLASGFDRNMVSAARKLEQMREVNRAELDDSDKERHERRLHCMAEQIGAVDNARNKLGLASSSRTAMERLRDGRPELPKLAPTKG